MINTQVSSQIYKNIINNVILYRTVLVCSYLILAFFITKIMDLCVLYIENKIKKTEHAPYTALLLTLHGPLKVFVWITCLYRILVLNKISISFIFDLRVMLISIIIIWLIFRFINQYAKVYIENREKNKKNIDYDGIDFFKKLAQIFSTLVVIILCLSRLGVSTQSLTVISGAGSLVIGLAAKEMLSNVFGGLMIYLDKPFSVGDWISSPDKDIEGDVEEIGWRRTRILTFAKHPIYVANSVFMDIIIENKTRMKSRRIDETIPVRYLDIGKMDKIVKDIKTMLKDHPNINHRLITLVAFDSVSLDAVLNLKIYAFTNTIEWLRYTEIKQDVLLKTVKIIHEHGGELSYGVKEVIVRKEKPAPEIEIDNIEMV
ncbi:MAG: mechanosensitive ion channel family protein [Rickettsiales bacterium]|nr:mechanosensitive ion channel family protein [Rickettsiales bacterium]